MNSRSIAAAAAVLFALRLAAASEGHGTGRPGFEARLEDEREDPARSTRAAARYLKDLHRTFGDWALALAAYNGGENRVLGAMRRTAAADFWELAARRSLPQETRDYVPTVLAVISLLEPREETE